MNQPFTYTTTNLFLSFAETFTFSAKEKDAETGYSYFGSRYYTSDLSIWLSVDPQASKYPHQSNYVYCSNNPIKVIDPNGEDEWDLARDGTLTKRENGRTDIDIVHATTSEGEATSRKFPAKSINKGVGSYPYNDGSQDQTTKYMTFDKQTGFDFFEFAAENTDVEWAISSSDNESRVGTATVNNVCLPSVDNETEFYHSHDADHTGKSFISQNDWDNAKESMSSGSKTGIYMAGEKQYYMFECKQFPNGVFCDFFGTKSPERKRKCN